MCTGGRGRGALPAEQSRSEAHASTTTGESTLNRRSLLETTALAGAGAVVGATVSPAQAAEPDCSVADRFVSTSNYSTRQHEINWIVVHKTAGSYAGAINWFQNPDSNVSSHYTVSNYEDTAYEPGHVTQMVHEEHAAWHARSIANHRSVGVDFEWIEGKNPDEPISDACYETLATLIECIADRHDIPLEYYEENTCIQNAEGGIIGHQHVPDGSCDSYEHHGKICPRPDFDPDTLMAHIDGSTGGGGGGDDGSDDGFQEGDEVVSTVDLNGRNRPNLDSEVVTVLAEGTAAEIINGPETNDGYTWWGLYVPSEPAWVWSVEQYLELADGGDPAPEPPRVSASTESASGIGETAATLNGSVTELANAEGADVWFEYGQSGSDLSNATSAQSVSATGSVDATIRGLSAGTSYEFRTVAESGDVSDSGATRSFSTDESSTDIGCFITTATHRQPETLDALRRFRDESMSATPVGRGMVGLYYRISPPIAATLARHPESRTASAVRSIVRTCADLSDTQDGTDSTIRSVALGILLTLLYVVGILVAAGGHAGIHARETLQ